MSGRRSFSGNGNGSNGNGGGGRRFQEKKVALEKFEEGQVLEGTVKNVTNYGAFVDIGGIDGLLHISNMSQDRISHPSEVINVGDVVTVKIVSIDTERARISLSLEQ